MERPPLMVQATSGVVGPVHSKVNLINPTTTTIATTQSKKNASSQSFVVEVPLKMAARERRQHRDQEDHQWSGASDCVSSNSMIQNYLNFKQSDAPARIMQWSGGAWVQLSGEVVARAKSAFLDRDPTVEIEVDGNGYIFDFYRMLQIDLGSGMQRSIAWIDVNDKCFFPKFFVDDESLLNDNDDDDEYVDVDDDEYVDEGVDAACNEIPKIEIEIKIDTNNSTKNKTDNDDNLSGCGKRKRKVREGKLGSNEEDEDTAGSSCNNSRTGNAKRQRMVPAAAAAAANLVNSTWPKARLLSDREKSFSVVRDMFMTGMKTIDPGVRITSIYQFTRPGPIEKARWEAFNKQMEITEAARGQSNTVFAWHGVSKKGLLDILAHGFGWPSKIFGPQAHGVGVYLSPARLPHVSDVLSEADDNGEKHLVLCRVILGNVERVEAGSKQFLPSSVNVDTGTDDLINPKWYVVWSTNMNTHILPECVVTYKCSDCQQGQTKTAEFMNWIPNGPGSTGLFSKLETILPAAKAEELKALCMTFKAGKMAKDLFFKQLKTVVGNEVLRSAISEIQCSKSK